MQRLKQLCCDLQIPFEQNVSLSAYTTFRIGGPAPWVMTCANRESLISVLNSMFTQQTDFILLGEGSNVLVSDQGLNRIIVRAFSNDPVIERSGNFLTVYAGTRLDDVAACAVENSLEGLVFASGIPGTFGGAVVGNAGAFGKQMSDCLVNVELLDHNGQRKIVPADELNFSYRESKLKYSQDAVLSATLQLKPGDRNRLRSEREATLALRHSKHPDYKKVPCAGSFFKNIVRPDGSRTAAGWFLDQAGCKTLTVGDAAIFEGHANIVINRGRAKAQEIYALTRMMQQKVLEKFQIKLEPEVRMLGEFD